MTATPLERWADEDRLYQQGFRKAPPVPPQKLQPQTCRCEIKPENRATITDEDGVTRCWKCGKAAE